MSRPIHIHVEEPSMEAFLIDFIPRNVPMEAGWKIIDHGSKWQLLRRLPDRLRGYAKMPYHYRPRTLVLVDKDDDDCAVLKSELERICLLSQLTSRTSAAGTATFDVINRIVIEELEAWYFGDVVALTQAWPGVSTTLGQQAKFRDPDAIAGGTHETLLRVLQRAGYFRGLDRLPKIDSARRMGSMVERTRNQSASFQQFVTGLDELVAMA